MIHKYSPLISDKQRTTCGECYINVVKDKVELTTTLDDSVCVPLLINSGVSGNSLPLTGWSITNNYPPSFVPDPLDPMRDILVENSLYFNAMPFTYYKTTQVLPTGCAGNYIILEQPMVLTQTICGDYHRLKITTNGAFINCSGTVNIEIVDSLNAIVFEQIVEIGVVDICFQSGDTNFTIKYTIEIIDPYRYIPRIPHNKDKRFEIYEFQVCEVYVTQNNIFTERFNNPLVPIKNNVIVDNSFCIDYAHPYMILEYYFDFEALKQYSLDILTSSAYPTNQTLVVNIYDSSNLLVDSDSYVINSMTTELIRHNYTTFTTGTYKVDIIIGNGDDRICINKLWLSDVYDLSNLGLDSCNGSGDFSVKCNCHSIVYTWSNLSDYESGYVQFDRDRYYFVNAGCEGYIRLRYHNDCPIATDVGDYDFHIDEYGNATAQDIVMHGFIFATQPKFEEGTQRSSIFNRRRVFSQAVFERDIEVNGIPEELMQSLTLALMCKYIYADFGDGVWREVFAAKDSVIDVTPNELGTCDVKFSLTYGGIVNSPCNCN